MTDSTGLFDERFEEERIDFNLHGRIFLRVKDWKAQLQVGYNQPIIADNRNARYIFHGTYTFVFDDETGQIFNEARRSINLLNTINNAEYSFLAELYVGKEIIDRLFLNAGIKYSLPNPKTIIDYSVVGNLGEANGFIYDDTEYELNRTKIDNRILMYSLGITYDIDFRDLF